MSAYISRHSVPLAFIYDIIQNVLEIFLWVVFCIKKNYIIVYSHN